MFDAGTVSICALVNTASPGDMPVEQLNVLDVLRFGELTVGVQRFYAAQGVNQQIDLLVRTWRCPEAQAGRYAVLANSAYDGQYRIQQVQHRLDNDGLKVTDISLSKLEDNYDVATQ